MNCAVVLVITFTYLVSEGYSTTDLKKTENKIFKFPPCQSCKILVKSFQAGIERTSRGKLEGGDTAWEEENKLSYAKSEIRLIEIQEKVCGEVDKGQHQCQSLAEENEGLLEEWWQNQDELGNLYDWLCINKLEICCSDLHYGPNCTPCTGFPDRVCNNNGKCKGAGTRKGNGQCSCSVGYDGETCDKCAKAYFEAYKDESNLICSPCHQSCQQACTQAGPRGCLACKSGWLMDSEKGCTDINECITLMHACTPHQFCVNNEGTFICLECDKACARCDGDGPDMCLECADGYFLNGNFCEDGRKQSSEQALNLTRYLTYLGLCIATYIVFQRNLFIASLIGLLVAIYISVSEYLLNSGIVSSEGKYNIGNIIEPK